MDIWAKEIRYGARMLARSPVVTVVAIVSLSLGIGANTAIYSWMNAVLLQPLRVDDPERVVRMHVTHPGFPYGSYSWLDVVDQRRMNDTLDGMVAFRPTTASLREGDSFEKVGATLVSANFFDFFGARMARGRGFRPDENEVPGRDPVAVISHGLWQRRFAGDPQVVGRTIPLNGSDFTVVGVAPAGFRIAAVDTATDVWVPAMMQPVLAPDFSSLDVRGARSFLVFGRMKDGVTLPEAQENFDAVAARLAEDYPRANGDQGVLLLEGREGFFPPDSRPLIFGMFLVLMGVVGFVLLIACANVANLLLARASRRRREVGVRLALGAGRARLVRQLLTESAMLAALAGVAGVGVAAALNRAIMTIQPPLDVPITFDVPLDLGVLAFTALATLGTGLIFGIVPALQATRTDLAESLRSEGAGDRGSSGRSRLRGALVVGQIALSMVLLVGTGMFLRSLENAQAIDPGFDPEGVLVASIDPGLQGYELERSRELYGRLVEAVEALPGVGSVALAETVPFGFENQQWGATIAGYEADENERMNFDYNFVGPGYFETMGIPVIAGRAFTPQDDGDSQGVLIVNQTMAERYWPDGQAIGGTVSTLGRERTVVGIVADSKVYSIGEDPLPYMYGPYLQSDQQALRLHVRTAGDPSALIPSLRAEVRAIDPDLPLFDLKTMEEQVDGALLFPRLTAGLLGGFGALALGLAAIGLYGVIAYAVAARTREIGIRMALGADRGKVIGWVLRHAGRLAGLGLVLGVGAGLGLGWATSSLLYDVDPVDPLALGAGLVTIVLVTFMASYLPARRATRVDPVTALRID